MGTVNVVFAKAGDGVIQVFQGTPYDAQGITSSGTSARTANAAAVACVARVTTDTAIYIKAGPGDPTATANGDWYLSANASLDIAINAGDKIAVIDA